MRGSDNRRGRRPFDLFVVFPAEANLAFAGCGRRRHKLTDGGDQSADGLVMGADLPLQLGFLSRRQLKNEICGKAALVSLDLLIQPLRGYAVKEGQISVYNDFLSVDEEDARLYFFNENQRLGHAMAPPPEVVTICDHLCQVSSIPFRPWIHGFG